MASLPKKVIVDLPGKRVLVDGVDLQASPEEG